MILAVGTTRKPKLLGIQHAVDTCPYFTDSTSTVQILPHNADSGISHMPLTIEEVMLGARNRAQSLKTQNVTADYYVGVEGGATRIGERSYLLGCIYIENAIGDGHYGFSPFVEIPEDIARRLYHDKEELGPIMEELSQGKDVRSENGSMGEWTDDMLTRTDQFATAFRAAIAPFYNQYYKH